MKREWVLQQYIAKVDNTKKEKSVDKRYSKNEKTRYSANASHALVDTDEVIVKIILNFVFVI